MTVLHRLQAAKGQSDKREETDSLSFILPTAAFSQPAPQTLTVYCVTTLALSSLLPEIQALASAQLGFPGLATSSLPMCGQMRSALGEGQFWQERAYSEPNLEVGSH